MTNICSNCGQSNAAESSFCRFCGVESLQRLEQSFVPPRPYAWQTDEFEAGGVKPSASFTTEHSSARTMADFAAASGSIVPAGPGIYPAGSYRCPRCGTNALPITQRQVSQAGWIAFAVLLVTTFIFFWVGLLMREDATVCPVCGLRLN